MFPYREMLGTETFAHPAVLALRCIAAKTREGIIGELCSGSIADDTASLKAAKHSGISTPAMQGSGYPHFSWCRESLPGCGRRFLSFIDCEIIIGERGGFASVCILQVILYLLHRAHAGEHNCYFGPVPEPAQAPFSGVCGIVHVRPRFFLYLEYPVQAFRHGGVP